MEFKLFIKCECGNEEDFVLNRSKDYGDNYFSISDNVSGKFIADIMPDTVYMNCTICGKREQVTI